MFLPNGLTENTSGSSSVAKVTPLFFTNPKASLPNVQELDRIMAKNKTLKEIEIDELKMIRNLDDWDFLTKALKSRKLIDQKRKNHSNRVAKIIENSENHADRTLANININVIDSISRGYGECQPPKPAQMETPNDNHEVKNSFPLPKNTNQDHGVIGNDHTRFLVYESVKNSALREKPANFQNTELQTPHLSQEGVLYDQLKVAAHKIINNFEHLKGSMNEKYLNYPVLITNAYRDMDKGKFTTRAYLSDPESLDQILFSSQYHSPRANLPQKCVNAMKYTKEKITQICAEISTVVKKSKDLEEEHRKLLALMQEMESRNVG